MRCLWAKISVTVPINTLITGNEILVTSLLYTRVTSTTTLPVTCPIYLPITGSTLLVTSPKEWPIARTIKLPVTSPIYPPVTGNVLPVMGMTLGMSLVIFEVLVISIFVPITDKFSSTSDELFFVPVIGKVAAIVGSAVGLYGFLGTLLLLLDLHQQPNPLHLFHEESRRYGSQEEPTLFLRVTPPVENKGSIFFWQGAIVMIIHIIKKHYSKEPTLKGKVMGLGDLNSSTDNLTILLSFHVLWISLGVPVPR
jgi:hypothetical protein